MEAENNIKATERAAEQPARMSEKIAERLKVLMDIYPVNANIEDPTLIRKPWGVYSLTTKETYTKDATYLEWPLGIFIVADGYEACEKLAEDAIGAVKGLKDEGYIVTSAESEVKYDNDDRTYYAEVNILIKE